MQIYQFQYIQFLDKKTFQTINRWLKIIKEINLDEGYILVIEDIKYKQFVVPLSEGQNYIKNKCNLEISICQGVRQGNREIN